MYMYVYIARPTERFAVLVTRKPNTCCLKTSRLMFLLNGTESQPDVMHFLSLKFRW